MHRTYPEHPSYNTSMDGFPLNAPTPQSTHPQPTAPRTASSCPAFSAARSAFRVTTFASATSALRCASTSASPCPTCARQLPSHQPRLVPHAVPLRPSLPTPHSLPRPHPSRCRAPLPPRLGEPPARPCPPSRPPRRLSSTKSSSTSHRTDAKLWVGYECPFWMISDPLPHPSPRRLPFGRVALPLETLFLDRSHRDRSNETPGA